MTAGPATVEVRALVFSILKRLDRALADGDSIHAIIVESGVNHDGKTSGIFLPNPDAQEALARSIYAKAGVDPLETLFVETHGTGTVVGTFCYIPATYTYADIKANETISQATKRKYNPFRGFLVEKPDESRNCLWYVRLVNVGPI